ncbi:hypothetical protein BS47DRAFT_1359834 [Hydnum rufescens UP504]|uniref:Uncharacterized protein n=1 Tax=Hydnum rufescens UP504 TaxID=1448309 RepID=A0A9P6B510_9AGAM|nr:hypothetical protein BS47DRAFT_1359834 [Hydnum rufescens UP504]
MRCHTPAGAGVWYQKLSPKPEQTTSPRRQEPLHPRINTEPKPMQPPVWKTGHEPILTPPSTSTPNYHATDAHSKMALSRLRLSRGPNVLALHCEGNDRRKLYYSTLQQRTSVTLIFDLRDVGVVEGCGCQSCNGVGGAI